MSIVHLQVANSLALYGAVEIPSRVLHGVIASRRYISPLTHVGLSMCFTGLGVLILFVWTAKEALYLANIICGS